MISRVAVVDINEDCEESLRQALNLIGGIEDINTQKRNVCIKVGVFQPRWPHHTSVNLVRSLVDSFGNASRIFLTESDNYVGKALNRLQVYKSVFTDRVVPFSLSEDKETKRLKIAKEEMSLSHVMFKPNVFVDTHVLRSFPRGSILKNLFGCTPMVQKAKYHKSGVFGNLIADIYEAIGGIDLAVADGTYLFHAATQIKVRTNTIMAGRDAVAVETVMDSLAGLKPEKMEVMQEFARRGLGEGNMENIEIVGMSREEVEEKFKSLRKKLRIQYNNRPRSPSVARTIDKLIEEDWMNKPKTVLDVLDELKKREVSYAKEATVYTALRRREGKTLDRFKGGGEWTYRQRRSKTANG